MSEAPHLEQVKKYFLDVFRRELSDAEAEEYLTAMQSQTRLHLQDQGKTEEEIKRHLNRPIAFTLSPHGVHAEVRKVIEEVGVQALSTSSKYKRMAEMVDAASLAFALEKLGEGKWFIKTQDSPDVLLIQPQPKDEKGRAKVRAISLEIMQIPQIQKERFTDNTERDIANFIREKKFLKRYDGLPHLLVHFNFDHSELNLKIINEEIIKMTENPFHQIFARINADGNQQVVVARIYPKFGQITLDFANDNDLKSPQ